MSWQSYAPASDTNGRLLLPAVVGDDWWGLRVAAVTTTAVTTITMAPCTGLIGLDQMFVSMSMVQWV